MVALIYQQDCNFSTYEADDIVHCFIWGERSMPALKSGVGIRESPFESLEPIPRGPEPIYQ
jgi:hypothetical protein